MPLEFDVAGIGPSNTNAAVVARLPLGLSTIITSVTAIFNNGGPVNLNIVLSDAAESGTVAATGAIAVSGNQVFANDAGQVVTTPALVYTFTPPTLPIYPAGTELTLRAVTGAMGVGGLKVLVYTTADAQIVVETPTPAETSFNQLDYQPQRFYPFGMPYQPLAQWMAFSSTAGPFTYTISPGFTLGSIYFPNITAPIELFAGNSSTSPAVPFYTTGSGGAEVVPLPSGLTTITLYAPEPSGTVMYFFITSSIFDPEKTTPSSVGVVTVTGTAPIFVTGGANPVVSLLSPLPIVNGGNGSATPGLLGGANIAISGTWPNQVISLVGVGPYISSVSGTGPITSSGGLTPSIGLQTPLAPVYGGTGQTNPSLVGGTGITVTGTWPNQTISASTASNYFFYNTGTYGAATVLVGTGTTGAGGTFAVTYGYAIGVVSANGNASGGTPYIINATIAGNTVTFTAFTTGGAATTGVTFSYQIVGH